MSTKVDSDGVIRVLNTAADDVLDWLNAADEGARDVVNLVINVFGERMRGSEISVSDVIRNNYDASPSEVREWCG